MADRHDPRYVDSNHPAANYWARVGGVHLGAWTGDGSTLDEFREAVRDEHRLAFGEEPGEEDIQIEGGC